MTYSHATCLQVQERFRHAYEEVKSTMAQLYSFFQHDSEEVQREWLKFTQKVLSSGHVASTLHGLRLMAWQTVSYAPALTKRQRLSADQPSLACLYICHLAGLLLCTHKP